MATCESVEWELPVAGDAIRRRVRVDRSESKIPTGVTATKGWLTAKADVADADIDALVSKPVTPTDVVGTGQVEVNGLESGTAQAGAASSITLRAGAPGPDPYYTGFFVNDTVTITGGIGAGQSRTITAYDPVTKIATVGTAWTTPPDNTSAYDIYCDVVLRFDLLRADTLAIGVLEINGARQFDVQMLASDGNPYTPERGTVWCCEREVTKATS